MSDSPDPVPDLPPQTTGRRLSVVLPYWFDRPDDEALEIARNAERAGFERLWVGEMATFDAFALAGAIARETERIELVVGPLAAGVRSPAALALGISSIERLGGRPAHLALGASSPEIVQGWHGVPWGSALGRLKETFESTTPILRGERADYAGDVVRSRGFKLSNRVSSLEITAAVFGPATLTWGARHARRLVLNLLTEVATSRLCRRLTGSAKAASTEKPHLCLWQVLGWGEGPGLGDRALQQVTAQLAAYLAAPGYSEMFVEAGAGELVERARRGEPRHVLARELTTQVVEKFVIPASADDAAPCRSALARRFDAGIDEIAIVPVTAEDPGATKLLTLLAD